MSTPVYRNIWLCQIAIILLFLFTAPLTNANPFSGYATPYEAHLHWHAAGDDGSVGTASFYDLRYATEFISESNWYKATQVENEPTPSPSGTPESMTISELEPNTKYYFSLRVADESLNWSKLSSTILITTLDEHFLTVEYIRMVPTDKLSKKDRSRVTILIKDQHGQPVPGALVDVIWSGPRTKSASALTNESGLALLSSPAVAIARSFWCLKVVDVSCEYYAYYPAIGTQTSVCDEGLGAFSEDPTEFSMSQNFPNPFNPTTEISFNLPEATRTRLTVYNIRGQQIIQLVDQYLPAGEYSFPWTAGNIASGIYFYRIEAGHYSETRKMVLLK